MASSLSKTNSHKTKKFSATCPTLKIIPLAIYLIILHILIFLWTLKVFYIKIHFKFVSTFWPPSQWRCQGHWPHLGYAHCEHPVPQLLPDKQSEHLEGRLEPQRRRHNQHLLQASRITTYNQKNGLWGKVLRMKTEYVLKVQGWIIL